MHPIAPSCVIAGLSFALGYAVMSVEVQACWCVQSVAVSPDGKVSASIVARFLPGDSEEWSVFLSPAGEERSLARSYQLCGWYLGFPDMELTWQDAGTLLVYLQTSGADPRWRWHSQEVGGRKVRIEWRQ